MVGRDCEFAYPESFKRRPPTILIRFDLAELYANQTQNHLVNAEPMPPVEEHLDFWHGFPQLAGAMNTAPLVPVLDWEEGGHVGNGQFEQPATGWWDEHWDASLLGLPLGNGLS
jgi:hypothetical protein